MKGFSFDEEVIKDSFLNREGFDKIQKDLLLDNIKRVNKALEEFFKDMFGVTASDIEGISSRVNNFKFKHLESYNYPDQDVYLYKGSVILDVRKSPFIWQIKKCWSKNGG